MGMSRKDMKNRTLTLLCAATIAAVQIVRAANVTVTNTNDSGAGSLRQAISSANPNDTIVFNASVTGTITLTTGQLIVNKNLTISGPGAHILSVSGNNASRVFAISSGTTVTISGLTIRDGLVNDFGGGILNDRATLTVNNCTLTNNRASGGSGGGIANLASGLTSVAQLTVTNSTLAGNRAEFVGETGGAGGGIYNRGSGSGTATLTVTNSTLSGNSATAGGAIENLNEAGNNATVTLTHSTLSGNSAGQGGGIRNADLGSGSASLTIGNTILHAGFFGENIFNFSAILTSSGYNLSSDAAGGDGTTAPGGFLNATGDRRNTNPKLGPLQNNGGPTLTHGLLLGSPAIDAGSPSFTPPPNFDQRGSGFPRVVNGRIDIGALEASLIIVTNNNNAGAGSLRQALIGVSDGQTIFFAPAVTGTITLSSGELLVNKNVVITGPGANVLSVSGNNVSRVFHIAAGKTVTISDLTIENGNASGQGGGGIDNEHATVWVSRCNIRNNSADFGAGLFNDGFSSSAIMTVLNCTVSGNTATSGFGGGGIYNHGQFGSGKLTLINNTISGNSAAVGGGIYNNGISGSAPLTLTNVTLTGSSGGGIYNDGSSGGSAPLSLRNTILNAGPSGANISNVSGTITSLGYNLSSDHGGGFLTATGDQFNTDPKLGPLQDNGGPTLTHAPLIGSPVINGGDPNFDPNAFNPPLVNDQRGAGFARVFNGRIDIGALEQRIFTVTNLNDNGAGSLRQALIDAADADFIGFDFGLTGTITLSSGELVVDKNATIVGPGAAVLSVSGNNASRVFRIGPGKNVLIYGLTIQNGNAAGSNGGGIYNDRSALTVDSCTLSNNSANNGGAMFNDGTNSNATLTIKNCTLSANQAGGAGGALFNEGANGGQGTLTLINSTLSGNTADTGGAIFNFGVGFAGIGSLTVSNSTLSGNSATSGNGGGIYNAAGFGSAQMSIGNTILKNGAAGGNIVNNQGVVTSLGCNLSSDNGGGVLTATGDQINTDPILGPLKNNGGPTLTYAPLSNSPAIDRGKDINTTGRDQRGGLRPVTYNDSSIVPPIGGDRSDIGAVELAPAIRPISADSLKTHAGAPFAIALPLRGNPGIECRSGGPSGDYLIIIEFAEDFTFNSADVIDGTGEVATSTSVGPAQVFLELTGVTNMQTITIALFADSGDIGIRMGVLLGDTSGNGTVNSTDVSQTKLRSGQAVGEFNFRSDVNANGAINATDVSTVKLRSGSSLP
jgi:dockerin type I repeat protein